MSLPLHQSVKGKLLTLTLIPIVLTLLALIGLTAYWTSSYVNRQLYMKVAADLSVARSTLQMMQNRQLERLQQLSNAWHVHKNLTDEQRPLLSALVNQIRDRHDFDFLRLLDMQQLEQARQNEPSLAPLIAQALEGKGIKGLSVIEQDEMQRVHPDLAEQATIQVVPTPRARPSDKSRETRAMFVRTLYPVFDANGDPAYLLDGGVMLNHNLQFVDTIRELVYGPDTLPEGGIGTVTLFLDDTRITTNVPAPGSQLTDTLQERAIGTRISEEVYNRVLGEELMWLDRAFVVSDWYVSAYEPIYDLHNQLIGVLYAGFSEGPFIRAYLRTLLELGAILAIILLISALLVWRSASRLFAPVKRIHQSVMEVRAGNNQARIGRLETGDEMADLAHHFDAMLNELDARQSTIRQSAERLEHLVEERTLSLTRKTLELEEHIELLKATREELFTKEKLAVLGELTAGIAHEINNPAAVILGHMDLLQAELGPDAADVQEEIDTVIEQVYRIQAIINNLLQYSRPDQVIDQLQVIDINRTIEDTEALVRHALDKKGIGIALDFTEICDVEGNRQQIQQVLINLLLNAANAMEHTGDILVRTRPWHAPDGAEGVCIHVEDYGQGISEAVLDKIFDPFFTTREGGNGLGLSISRSLTRRYGGDLRVKSTPGHGSTFTVLLRAKALIRHDDEATMQQLLAGLGVA